MVAKRGQQGVERIPFAVPHYSIADCLQVRQMFFFLINILLLICVDSRLDVESPKGARVSHN